MFLFIVPCSWEKGTLLLDHNSTYFSFISAVTLISLWKRCNDVIYHLYSIILSSKAANLLSHWASSHDEGLVLMLPCTLLRFVSFSSLSPFLYSKRVQKLYVCNLYSLHLFVLFKFEISCRSWYQNCPLLAVRSPKYCYLVTCIRKAKKKYGISDVCVLACAFFMVQIFWSILYIIVHMHFYSLTCFSRSFGVFSFVF